MENPRKMVMIKPSDADMAILPDVVTDYIFDLEQEIDAMSTWLEGEIPTVEILQDMIFDNLYSNETDRHLKIEDIYSNPYNGCPGYSAVSLNIAKAIHAIITRKLKGEV